MLGPLGMLLLEIIERLIETWVYFSFGTSL